MLGMLKGYKKVTLDEPVMCNRCLDNSTEVYQRSTLTLCDDCYEFLLDLAEAGEHLSMNELASEY